MLKLVIPKSILNWMLINKGSMSLPVFIIHCVAYIRDNNINIVKQEREQHQERGGINDRTERLDKKGKN